jgi:hypothetical protein
MPGELAAIEIPTTFIGPSILPASFIISHFPGKILKTFFIIDRIVRYGSDKDVQGLSLDAKFASQVDQLRTDMAHLPKHGRVRVQRRSIVPAGAWNSLVSPGFLYSTHILQLMPGHI